MPPSLVCCCRERKLSSREAEIEELKSTALTREQQAQAAHAEADACAKAAKAGLAAQEAKEAELAEKEAALARQQRLGSEAAARLDREEAAQAESLALLRKREVRKTCIRPTMRVELIGHFKPCMPDIYIHI